MPRFGAENVPNALQEQMWREMLGDAAFNKTPMSGTFELEEFNPNFSPNYVPPGPNEFVPQEMGPYVTLRTVDPTIQALREMEGRDTMRRYDEESAQSRMLDPMLPNTVFNDSKTVEQAKRERRTREEAYFAAKPEILNPLHQNNPPARSDYANEGGNTNMQRLYNDMPLPLPRYPGMVMPAPDESNQMDQLMEFYTDENI